MAVVDTDTFKHELHRELRRRGHNIDRIDITHTDDNGTHIHVHLRSPLWWTAMRWLIVYPLTIPYRLTTRLEDRWEYHAIRGHHIEHNVTMGAPDGPMHTWSHYCHTCEAAW